MSTKLTRREAMTRAGALLGAGVAAAPLLSACGDEVAAALGSGAVDPSTSGGTAGSGTMSGSGTTMTPMAVTPTYDISTPLNRLKAFMTGVVGAGATNVTVSQGAINNIGDPLTPFAQIFPPPLGPGVNPNPATLADVSQVWGYRRDTWTKGPSVYFYSAGNNAGWYRAVGQLHQAASQTVYMPTALHFIHTGRAFEVLILGTNVQITLIADGQYCSRQWIGTTLTAGGSGRALNVYNTYTRFDFDRIAARRISLYCSSSYVGPCAIAIGPQDTIAPWDRSNEPSFCAMGDSYAQGASTSWFTGGPFWVAASLLGIPHIDLNAMGATGYAPVSSPYAFTQLAGNTFGARLTDSVRAAPDLFVTGGGINDQYGMVVPPLYTSVAQANVAFTNAVNSYYRVLRAALPTSVLVALGPWAPKQSTPTNALAQAKLNIITQAMQSITGPWLVIDNLNGGWLNSAGVRGLQTGPWQTGTGNAGAPNGTGNGDIYVGADGTHPTVAGHDYLGKLLASNLAAGILAL